MKTDWMFDKEPVSGEKDSLGAGFFDTIVKIVSFHAYACPFSA
jgi:hypothetical protein